MGEHEHIVQAYAEATAQDPCAGMDIQAACRRYLDDRQNGRWDFRTDMPEFVIAAIQTLFCHQQGEDLYGRPLRGKPLILEPFQMFIIYNVCGFYLPGSLIRRFQEAFLMLARKNGKTPFATALTWAVGLWYAKSFSKIKTVAGSMKQNMEGFGFLSYNLHRLGLTAHEDQYTVCGCWTAPWGIASPGLCGTARFPSRLWHTSRISSMLSMPISSIWTNWNFTRTLCLMAV